MLSMKDAIIERCLEGVAQGDFDLHGVADVKDLFDKLRNYRAQLPVLHPLKKCILPDERTKLRPVRSGAHRKGVKLKAGG